MVMRRQALSLVVPVLNEEKNITPLVTAIHSVCTKNRLLYEIIFVDDHSTDKTKSIIIKLQNKYPLRYFLKKGKPGKAFSLLEGFTHTRYRILGMIDADLQYPPTILPHMIKMLKTADIIVANRKTRSGSFHRKLISYTFSFIFGKLLHGLDCDVQSGLKVFKREAYEAVRLHPTAWTFDLEFLHKARNVGFEINTVDIAFQKRNSGSSKIAFVKASVEIGTHAIKLKLSGHQIVPFYEKLATKMGNGFYYNGKQFIHHGSVHQKESAFISLTRNQKVLIVILITLFSVSLGINWHGTMFLLISLLTYLYFIDLLFNGFLIYRSFAKKPEISVSQQELNRHRSWPTYTVLCPLYKESAVLPQFITAMKNMNYPKEKLQVLLLIEEDDREMVRTLNTFRLPTYITPLMVPDSKPKTKPKACNYGLRKAKGEYSVIYDAEDIPDPLQLKKAVLAFASAPRSVVCIQAKLNFYNPQQNLLTRLFTAEYAVWFEMILTGLQSINAPIPLGGTSNHFRTQDLQKLHGWDPFNVTEDADLGVRLAKRGFTTAIIDSETMEEANGHFGNWFRQRSRWIKGYMQTYLVHNRRQVNKFNWSYLNQFIFHLVIGGKILSMLVNPLMWTMTLSYFLLHPVVGDLIESFFVPYTFYIAAFSLIIGNFLYSYYYMIGIAKRNQWELAIFTLFTPIYWLFMSAAAFYAVHDLIAKPYRWHKTPHGLHIPQALVETTHSLRPRKKMAFAH